MKRIIAAVCLLLITGCQGSDPAQSSAAPKDSAHALPSERISSTFANSNGPSRMIAPKVSRPLSINAVLAPWGNQTRTDIDGDRRSDVLWYNSSLPALAYRAMNGFSIVGSAANWTASGFRIVGTGDYDGDGFLDDVLWDRVASRTLYMWLSHGNETFASAYVTDYAPGWSVQP